MKIKDWYFYPLLTKKETKNLIKKKNPHATKKQIKEKLKELK